MKRHVWAVCLGVAAVLAGAAALATGTGEAESAAEEPEDAVLLGEEDLADRAEILRNMYRRITPPDSPLVQDVGTWPAAWEEFGANWDAAAADREYGAWVVPVEMSQDAGLTVVKDGDGTVLWHGWTDFARPESADVVLTGGLVAEEDWAAYEGVRDAVAAMRDTAGGTPAPPVMRTTPTNGLRFTAHEWTTNGTFRLELAYEIDTNVDIFAYAVACTSSLVVATWTNDENQVITDTNTVWTSVGLPFNGMESDWELRGTVAISNGVAEFEDSGFSEELSRLRFYAAAVAEDTDGDGLNDGWEDFVSHTDPGNQDSDGDGVPDGMDTMPATSNVWFEVVTDESWYYWEYRGTCGSNSPPVFVRSWPLSGQPPTSDSVVRNVRVSGFVDDGIKVDGHEVDFEPSTQTFTSRSILNEISDPQKRDFSLALWDYPDPNHAGENEVKLGASESDPFVVEWVWGIPMALTGPECVCVGDTAQFEAGGAGGGPYTWSVAYEGTTPVGEIDGDGVFTALAPGLATVTATAGEVYSVSQAVNVVLIEFLTGGGSAPATELKIAKWDNAFVMSGTNVALRGNFIDLDSDRFKVRVADPTQAGAGSVVLGLATTGSESGYNDGETEIDLYETDTGSGIFVSTNMLLVSDNIDDDYNNFAIPSDNATNDRTHKTAPGGKVLAKYPASGQTYGTKEIAVALEGTVRIIPIVMRNKPVSELGAPIILFSQVEDILAVARERFGQIGISLTWDAPDARDPLPSMMLTNSFLVRDSATATVLSSGARSLISEVGTEGNLTDIHVIFVEGLKAGDRPLSGNSVFGFYYDASEHDFFFNIFVNADYVDNEEYLGYIVAHELGHLLTNAGHELQDKWRLMYIDPDTRGIAGSRRFVTLEESAITGDSHVHR